MNYPYRSQWAPDATGKRNDCGPACVASVLDAFGKHKTVNELAAFIDPTDDGTNSADLIRAFAANGVTAVAWTGTGYPNFPAICLVRYDGFKRTNVQDVNYKGWHWLLVHSLNELTAVVHDPDFWGDRINEGAYKRYSRAEFDAAFIPYGQTKIAVVWPEATGGGGATIVPAAVIRFADGTKAVGPAPFTADFLMPATPDPEPSVPVIKFTASSTSITVGQSVRFDWTVDGVERVDFWNGVKFEGVGGHDWRAVTPTATGDYWLKVTANGGREYKSTVIKVTVKPVSVVTVKPLLGVNTITDAAAALDAEERGCRFFLIMDHPDVCAAIKARHPEAVVIDRRWVSDWKLDGRQMADKVGGSDNGVICELYNEGQSWGYGTVKEISDRINNEIEAMRILRSRGAKVCLGAYSVGCPHFPDDEICKQVRRYAEFYNSDPGVYFSMHLYSPNMQHIFRADNDQIWYERRWEYLFTKCGFDPAQRKLLCSETGIDEGSIGGFPAHNAATADFERWVVAWQALQAQPVMVNGVSYPSPLVGAAIFQCGNDPSWAGYNIAGWVGSLQRLAWT